MRFTIPVDDTVTLEAVWDAPARPALVCVFCHPNPLERGTMNAPLMVAVTRHLVDHGFAVLRFNFRGVGASTGHWDRGVGEIDDVAAAVDAARLAYPELPFGITGWSFGAVTALRWQARDHDASPYVGIAPAVRSEVVPPLPDPGELLPAPRSFVLGDRDQFTTVEELDRYATQIGARVHVLRGSDHFFYFREERVARLVAADLAAGAGVELDVADQTSAGDSTT